MTSKTMKWDVRDHLATLEACARYLESVIEEAADDPAFLVKAIGDIARARAASDARTPGPRQRALAKALAGESDPSFSRVLRILAALELRLTVEPVGAPTR